MRAIYSFFALLLALITYAQCQQTAEEWYDRGVDLSMQGNYEEAIQAYDEAIKLNPNLAEPRYNKALLYPDRVSMKKPSSL